jgi:hypothetical protein
MMLRSVILNAVFVATLFLNLLAGEKTSAPHSAKTSPRLEPFRSFAILDAKLSLLTSQQASLEATLNGRGPELRASTPPQSRAKLLNNMRVTTAEVTRLATHLQSRYAKQHRPFGVKILKLLLTRAHAVSRDIYVMQRARTEKRAQIADKRLRKRIVALVLQFQAVSGGYATTQCAAQEWTCCEPKRPRDLMPGVEAACRWTCLPKSNKCTGLLGPRIPRSPR